MLLTLVPDFKIQKYIWLHIITLMLFLRCSEQQKSGMAENHMKINPWYGGEQRFGHLGNPQRQINILGNLESDLLNVSLAYTLNGSGPFPLTLGSDLHRLASTGDFNVEIETKDLREGHNQVVIIAKDTAGNEVTREVKVHFTGMKTWELPYAIDWSKVEAIQDVAQVVDGKWQLVPGGIRTMDPYYDRVLALGDSTWKNYEVTTSVVFHDFIPPDKGPPTYNVSHAAIASRWPGHDYDSLQPNRKWFPVGATSEFRLTVGLDSCRWRIFDGENIYREDQKLIRNIILGKKYNMKHRVQTSEDSSTLYQVKLWEHGESEPPSWDLEAKEKPGDITGGSALLIAHNTDVTFGNVEVIPISL